MAFVLSLGGSLVASPVPQVEYIKVCCSLVIWNKHFPTKIPKKIADMLIRLKNDGIIGHVVIGGGSVARTYIDAARQISPLVTDDMVCFHCVFASDKEGCYSATRLALNAPA